MFEIDMELIITKPERKKDYYMGRVLTETRKPIQVVLDDVQWMRTVETRDQNQLVRVVLPPMCECRSILEDLDAKVFEICQRNNEKWFHNALDDDKLRAFFRPSVNREHSSMGILCNMWAEPVVYVDGQIADSLRSIHASKDAHVKMLVEAQGVVFQKTVFGIRWILRKCWIDNTQSSLSEWIHPFEDERSTIESYWEEEVEKYVEGLSKQIQRLEDLIQDIRGQLQSAKETTSGVEWNEILTGISKTIFQRDGALERSPRENQNFI
jgi:hypothetical protein